MSRRSQAQEKKKKSLRRISQTVQPIKQRLSNEDSKDYGESIKFFLTVHEQLKVFGASQFSYSQRIKIIKLFTAAIPQFSQLYKKINEKIFTLFRYSTLLTFPRNYQLTQNGNFSSIYILLSGQIQLETEQQSSDQILRPITLIGNNLLILNSKLLSALCSNEENILLSFQQSNFYQFFDGIIQKQNIYPILEVIKNAQIFKHLSLHQCTELCCAGKLINCQMGTIIVKQGYPLTESLFNQSSGYPFIYITISGSFTLSIFQEKQIDYKHLDLIRYLHNEHQKSEVPLLQATSTYSSSPTGQIKKNLIEICQIQEGQLIGIEELINEESKRKWTIISRQANSQILEVDLSYVDGWKRFEDILGLQFDNKLKTQLVNQISNRIKLQETLEQTINIDKDSMKQEMKSIFLKSEYLIRKKSEIFQFQSIDSSGQRSKSDHQVNQQKI